MNISVSDYFHYPKTKTKESSQLRNYITAKYGAIATLLLMAVIISIPIYNYLIIHNFHQRFKSNFIRSFNLKLDHYILHEHHPNCQTATWKDKFLTNVAHVLKKIVFNITLHSSTIIQLLFWTAFLGTLSLIDIDNGDLIYLAKRLGRLAANCLPAILFLTLRPSPLPHTLYLTLIPIHKWLSRLIILQSVIHTFLYLGYFEKKRTWRKAWKLENIYGWVALAGFLIIVVTSLSGMRKRWYKLFYSMHYLWTWVIVICLQFHVRPEPYTVYTIVNVSILMGQIGYRFYLTRVSYQGEVKVIDVSPNLSMIEIPNNLIAQPAHAPGAHVRLTDYSSNYMVRVFKQLIPNYHPYTLVSFPNDKLQRLIIRKSNFKLYNNRRYLIVGSYDPHLLFIQSLKSQKFALSKLKVNAKRLLIVIGGSAISFALPILRVMNYHGIPTKIVWVIKDFRDVLILKYFDGFIHGDDFEIFITGETLIKEQSKALRNEMSYASNISRRTHLSSHYDLERDETSPLLGDSDEPQITLNLENQIENVDISMNSDDEEDSDSDCTRSATPGPVCDDLIEIDDVLGDGHISDEIDDEYEESVDEFEVTNDNINQQGSRSRSVSRKSSINEPFIPYYLLSSSQQTKSWVQQYKSLIKKLNLENKIYKGRPKLNYRYYNWCINEGFTQCSGPVEDENHNLICCRDLPRNKVVQEDVKAEKIWVISAGPIPLVENVKLWASEYGLKFHEEAFYS
ncbi:putative ferric reductase transmembrane component 8 [Candida viswanathii]|uniref:Putative ferric reductase transmembrane component 8 n=1 Tax=Candida viswanathii TaxID=5486 RepID=A0A367YBK9_9ASCO|nr:putative ferric reductase transmembrane component 8 [Candida viswanathii]